MEYSPPPLFKQGASARAKVVFFALVSLSLLVADARLQTLIVVRQVVGTALYPLQVAALMPRDAAYAVAGYLSSLSALEDENRQLKKQQTANAQTLQQAQQLAAENAQLRKLLGASEQMPAKALMGEILYDARDAFTRKIVLNRGSQHGVAPGQPVIDDVGVVGQVTRVFPFTSEITLLTDKDQAIPVQVVRSGLRSVAYGHGQSGALDLRFMATNADIQKGDVLVTSGIDGVYPPGLTVGKVAQVETKSSDVFARIVCNPTAGIDRNRQLLILLVDTAPPPRPAAESVGDKKPSRRSDAGMAKEAQPHTAAPPAATDKAPANATPANAAPANATPANATPANAAPANAAPAKQAQDAVGKPDAAAKPVAKDAPQAAPDTAPKAAAPAVSPAMPQAAPKAPPQAAPKAAPPARPQAVPAATPAAIPAKVPA
jgi:rod shape-determining protein MreC